MTTAAIVGSAVIGAASSQMAASKQAKAAKQAAAMQSKAGEQVRTDLAPYREVGQAALYEMTALMGLPVNYPGLPSGWNGGRQSGSAMNQALQYAASLGRNGDTQIGHLTPGEVVVPQSVAANLPGGGMNALYEAYREAGLDPDQYIVGGEGDSYNPATNVPEYNDHGGDNDEESGDPGAQSDAQAEENDAQGVDDVGYDSPDDYDSDHGDDRYDNGFYGGRRRRGQHYDRRDRYARPQVPALPADYYTRQSAMARFFTSPDYQFRFQQGLSALDRSAAARGNLLSGQQLKAISEYGQNLASGEYANYYNRLAALAGAGQSSAAQTGNANLTVAENAGGFLKNAGVAQAEGIQGIGNAIGTGIGNLYNYYQNQQQPVRQQPAATPSYMNTYRWNNAQALRGL